MSEKTYRDLYVPTESWKTFVDLVTPKPRGTDPAFARALEQFQRYSQTISGDIGDIIRRCHRHLERFLEKAQEIIQEEAGPVSGRLGRLRDFPYGTDTLQFQVFNYKGEDHVSVREDRLADLMTDYDLFHDTMTFMEQKVAEGNLGIFKNSFTFIHKPLSQAATLFDTALTKLHLVHTTEIGKPADPTWVMVAGTEPSNDHAPGCIVRVLKPGYTYEGREIQEGVVIVAEKPEESTVTE